MSSTSRWLLALWFVVLLAGFGLSRLVTPDPRGFGTHQRFGLPPCSLILLFNIPCPSCGMTTSFAHFVRGEWPASVRSNPAGFVLALLCLAQLPWLFVSFSIRRWWLISAPQKTALVLSAAVLAVSLLQWIVRLV